MLQRYLVLHTAEAAVSLFEAVKVKFHRQFRFGLGVLWLLALPILAGQYAISWFTIDGGGTSTNGHYSVSGTVGQPDASPPMSGGNFVLTGGFWSLLSAVQMPGAPVLTIALTETNTAVVSWPLLATGYALQQNSALLATNWVPVSEWVTNDGANHFIIANPPQGNRLFRLVKQP